MVRALADQENRPGGPHGPPARVIDGVGTPDPKPQKFSKLDVFIYIYIYIYIHLEGHTGRLLRSQHSSEGGMIRLENPYRAQIPQFELFDLVLLLKLDKTALCRAIPGKSSDLRQQYLSQQYPPPL